MSSDPALGAQFPRSFRYRDEWIIANGSGAANPLWIAEWLSTGLNLRPGMRVLDLGCGRALSSIFLRMEFGVEVWAADLWFSASENLQRIRHSGVEEGVFPIQANARALPFAAGFFDAIVCIDSFSYFGTDDGYLSYLASFVKPGGLIAHAGAGLMQEIDTVPDHLREWWTQDLWSLHSAHWWRRHWERTGIVEIQISDSLPEGWKFWLAWHHRIAPENHREIEAVEADAGRYIGYVRVIARRVRGFEVESPIESVATTYKQTPMFE